MGVKTKKTFPYLDRDVSWMYFNRRILQEALSDRVPLLERLNFLGIYSSNLDEFFRVRMATLNRIVECGGNSVPVRNAKDVIRKVTELNAVYVKDYEKALEAVDRELEKENIIMLSCDGVSDDQLDYIHAFYRSRLSGNMYPVMFSSVRMMDSETDDSIYLAVSASVADSGKKESDYYYMELPASVCGRFVRIPDQSGRICFMYLDDVVRCSLPLVFEGCGYSSFKAWSFKFTRDAEMDIENDMFSGTLDKVSKGVKKRRKGEPLRVVYDSEMPKHVLKRILTKLDIDRTDTVVRGGRYQNHKDLLGFPDCGRADLRFPEWTPVIKSELSGPASILERIREADRFLHVPYHDFSSFLRVLQEAAVNRNVKSIKMTLYRLAKDSKVVKALVAAARNGKKVTVVIELMARFDEASNIKWSQKMQDAGINVVFGVEGLKVHSKLVHIGFRSGKDIACISTGNFHEGNAGRYTDFIFMTASRNIVKEVDSVFGFIEHPYSKVRFKELLVSPNEMRSRFMAMIDREIRNAGSGKVAFMKVKVNHITDPVMVSKLYEASRKGVRIELLVRGNCSLVPGVPGVSENIKAVGIIDRYLEHSRIFVFAAGGNEEVYIGSADWMPRNLDNRIEVIVPVNDPDIKKELIYAVDCGLADTTNGRTVDGSGENRYNEGPAVRSQEQLHEHYLLKEKEYATSLL